MPIYKFNAYVPVFRSPGKPTSEFQASRKLMSMEDYMNVAVNRFSKLDVCRRWKLKLAWTASVPSDRDPNITAKLAEQRKSLAAYEAYLVFEGEINYKDKTKPVERFFEALRETLVEQLDDQPYVYFYNAPQKQKGAAFSVMLDAGVMISSFFEKVPMVLLQTSQTIKLIPEMYNDYTAHDALKSKQWTGFDKVAEEIKTWYREDILPVKKFEDIVFNVKVEFSPLIGHKHEENDFSFLYINVEAKVPAKVVPAIVEKMQANIAEGPQQFDDWRTDHINIDNAYGDVFLQPYPLAYLAQPTGSPLTRMSARTTKSSNSGSLPAPYVSSRDSAKGSPVVVEDAPDAETSTMSLEQLRAEVDQLAKQIEGTK